MSAKPTSSSTAYQEDDEINFRGSSMIPLEIDHLGIQPTLQQMWAIEQVQDLRPEEGEFAWDSDEDEDEDESYEEEYNSDEPEVFEPSNVGVEAPTADELAFKRAELARIALTSSGHPRG